MTPEPTVVVIDDSATSCRIMEDILRKEGCRVKVAMDGREGIQMVLREMPRCVVLDVVLPGMSGYEVCRYLRSQVATLRNLPIIMVSTKNTPIDKTWALRQGATHYLVKPFDEREFIKLIKEAIASYEPSANVSKTNQRRVAPLPPRSVQEQIPQERSRAPIRPAREQESRERLRAPIRPAWEQESRERLRAPDKVVESVPQQESQGHLRAPDKVVESIPQQESQGHLRAPDKVVESIPPAAETPAHKNLLPAQKQDALPLYELIPIRNQGTDFMWEHSPHFLSTINPQARLLYSTIDGKQDIKTLCRTTRMSQEDVIRALRSLLMQHRVRLLEPGGRAISNMNFGSSEPGSNQP